MRLEGQVAVVTGAGITLAQGGLQLAGQHVIVRVIRAAHDKGAYRTEAGEETNED